MSKRVFVGNLSFGVTEEQLQNAFSAYGAVGATIPTRWVRSRQRADRPKGFGYVDLPERSLDEALRGMQGFVLDGRPLDIREAIPRPELRRWDEGGFPMYGRNFRGGGGGGFRGRRR